MSPERARQVETREPEPLDAHWDNFPSSARDFGGGRTWVPSPGKASIPKIDYQRNLKLLGSPLAAGRARGRRSERFERPSWLHDAVAYRRDPFTGSMCFYWQGKSTHSAKQARKWSAIESRRARHIATSAMHKKALLQRAMRPKSKFAAATLAPSTNEPRSAAHSSSIQYLSLIHI